MWQKSNLLRLFAVFSTTAWNFIVKIYVFVCGSYLHLTAKQHLIIFKCDILAWFSRAEKVCVTHYSKLSLFWKNNLSTVLYWRLCDCDLTSPIVKYPLNWGWCAWSAEGSVKQWLPNGKLLLLYLTKCRGVPCSLPSRIILILLQQNSWKTARLFLQNQDQNINVQDQDFMIQDQDFHFLSSRRLETRPWRFSVAVTRWSWST